jgi:regulator of replication initiation timing
MAATEAVALRKGNDALKDKLLEAFTENQTLSRENRSLRLELDKLRGEAGNALPAPGGPGSAPLLRPGNDDA